MLGSQFKKHDNQVCKCKDKIWKWDESVVAACKITQEQCTPNQATDPGR